MNSSHNKESSAGHSECHQCNHHHTVQSTQQTLDEMEFERGIWQAGNLLNIYYLFIYKISQLLFYL